MATWALKLADYNIEVPHKTGKENVVTDALSHNHQENVKEAEENSVVFQV